MYNVIIGNYVKVIRDFDRLCAYLESEQGSLTSALKDKLKNLRNRKNKPVVKLKNDIEVVYLEI